MIVSVEIMGKSNLITFDMKQKLHENSAPSFAIKHLRVYMLCRNAKANSVMSRNGIFGKLFRNIFNSINIEDYANPIQYEIYIYIPLQYTLR